MKITLNRKIKFGKIRRIASTLASIELFGVKNLEENIAKIALEYGMDYKQLLVLALSIEKLKEKFPKKSSSWIIRAAIRVMAGIYQLSDHVWKVPGLAELNDHYTWYYVWFDKKESTYKCDCYNHSWGLYRKYRICTHVAAVLVFKEMNRLMIEYLVEGK